MYTRSEKHNRANKKPSFEWAERMREIHRWFDFNGSDENANIWNLWKSHQTKVAHKQLLVISFRLDT